MKLLHIADLHLGTKFITKDKQTRNQLVDNQINVFNNIINYCIDNDVKVLLIAGDMFDGSNVPLAIEKEVISGFELLDQQEIKVYYSTGNHDPREDFERLHSLFGDNVKVFSNSTPEEILINDHVKVISCGHETSQEKRDLVKEFPVKKDDIFTIGLVHCNLEGYESEEGKYLPTSREVLDAKNYDYWAIGHIHKKSKVGENIYYPGSPQGINYKETNIKGGNLITILDSQSYHVDFVEFSTIYWKSVTIRIDKTIEDKYQLVDLLENKISRFNFNKNFLLKINLTGSTQLFLELNDDNFLEEIKNTLIDQFYHLIDLKFKTNDLKPYINYEEYISNKNILGYIHKRFEDDEKKDELIKRLMENKHIGSHLVDQDERYEYIERVLKQVKEETFLRMVGIHYED